MPTVNQRGAATPSCRLRSHPQTRDPSNAEIARTLEQVAKLLERSDANPFRVRSYLHAADVVRKMDRGVAEQLRSRGPEALTDTPGIGERLAGSIREIVETGRLRLVDSLEAELTPLALLTRVPGIGPTLARRIHKRLGVESLEQLETAAYDGRLAEIEGFGEQRVRGVRDALAGRLNRAARSRSRRRAAEKETTDPPVGSILEIDRLYRAQAEAGELRTIAPRRFNPQDEAWLPILETDSADWRFTALFSNTARAHELGKTRDWVVVYYRRKQEQRERQCTVITAGAGSLKGRRIVVGRESECHEHYTCAP